MTKDSKTAIRGSGRVGFLARIDGIKKMIDAGHPLLFIYKEHEKHLSISYSQFVKYVHKYLRSKPEDGDKPVSGVESKRPIKRTDVGQPKFTRTESRDDLAHPKPK